MRHWVFPGLNLRYWFDNPADQFYGTIEVMFVVNFFFIWWLLFSFSGCPVYCGLWCVRSSGMISSCSLFRFFVYLSTNLFFERKRISWRFILRAAAILRVWVCLFFSETGFNSLSTVISIQPIILKRILSRLSQLLRNFTANFRFLYHSVAESLSPSSLLNNNKVLSLAVVIAPFKQTSSFYKNTYKSYN